MNQPQPQPDTPKLSNAIGETIRWLAQNEKPTASQLERLLAFLERHMPHLHVFALDMEFAESRKGTPQALSHAAAASMRLYKRLTDIAAPVVVVRVPAESLASVPPIDLDRYRRGSLGDAA